MHTKKPTITLALLSISFLATTTFISCNNDEAKAPEKTEVAPTTPVTPDSPKAMTSEPAKPDSITKDTLKKGGLKPLTTKP
jgi:hypothetical protein